MKVLLVRTNISLDARSYSFNYTPTASALRLPFHLTAAGVCGETFQIARDQLFFLNCMDHHFYQTEGDEIWEFCYIQFSGPCVREYYDLFHESGVKPLEAVHKEYMMQKFQDILKIPGMNTRMPNLKISNLISDILTSMILEKCYIPDQKQYDRYKQDMTYAISYIENHFDQNVKLEEIADFLHISKYYFIKIRTIPARPPTNI